MSRLKRRWALLFAPVLVLAWVLLASIPGTSVMGCLAGCSQQGESESDHIRVVSLNLYHGFPKFEHFAQRLDNIAEEIVRLEADIVLLQEVPWIIGVGSAIDYLAEQTGMNHAYLRANGNRWAILFEEGEAILSRYPLTSADSVVLKPDAGFFEHRVALHATAITPAGDLDLYVTHLTNGDVEINAGQCESLLVFVNATRQNPAVITGDFNAQPDSPQILTISQAWLDTASNQAEAAFTCCVDDLRQDDRQTYSKRIDYMFIIGDLVVENTQRVFDQPGMDSQGWLWLSDHAGLLIDVLFFEE